jgi:hypothetical protein
MYALFHLLTQVVWLCLLLLKIQIEKGSADYVINKRASIRISKETWVTC